MSELYISSPGVVQEVGVGNTHLGAIWRERDRERDRERAREGQRERERERERGREREGLREREGGRENLYDTVSH